MDHCLEKININDPLSLDNWHQRFQLWIATNDKIDPTNLTQVTAFYLTMIGKDAFDLLKSLAYPEDVTAKSLKELQRC